MSSLTSPSRMPGLSRLGSPNRISFIWIASSVSRLDRFRLSLCEMVRFGVEFRAVHCYTAKRRAHDPLVMYLKGEGAFRVSGMGREVLKLDAKDNVLIALRDLRKGEQVCLDDQTYTLASDVPAKHKFAIQDLPAVGNIVMYGVLVGKATQPIRQGEVLTTLNTRHDAAAYRDASLEYRWTGPDVSHW